MLISGLNEIIAKHKNIFNICKGRGLMLGIQCKVPNSFVVDKLIDKGLLTVVAGDNVVRLLPPLNVLEEEINLAIDIIDKVASKIEV